MLRRLVLDTDVLVHNFRPSVPARLGIDYATLRTLNRRLVYCAVTGYGEHGPLRDKAGYDQVLQAMTGICAMQGSTEQPQIVYGSVVDYYAAALLAGSVASALYARERTGEGQYVGISLLRSALAMQSARLVWAEGEPRHVHRDMRSGGITGLHPTREGSLYLSANTPHFWAALCELIGLPELAANPRYDTVRKRAEHAARSCRASATALRARTALEWEQHFGERVPCSAVREVEDMFDHEQVRAEAMIGTFEHPLVGQLSRTSPPPTGSARRRRRVRAARRSASTRTRAGEAWLQRRRDRVAARPEGRRMSAAGPSQGAALRPGGGVRRREATSLGEVTQ